MKNLLVVLLFSLLSGVVQANITSSDEYVLNNMNSQAQKTQMGTLINKTPGLLIAKYSYAVQGGTTANNINLLTDLSKPLSYAKLPNKAIIRNVWLDITTGVASSGSATVGLTGQTALDLLAATPKASMTVRMLQGIPAGTTTSSIKLSAQRTIQAVIGTAPLSAGKFNVYIEYVLGE